MEDEVHKLEILQPFKNLYGEKIHKDLISLKYCQSKDQVFVEMTFHKELNITKTIQLDFIKIGENDVFIPGNDIVDNARLLIKFDAFCLINCIGNLFNHSDAVKITDDYCASNKFLSD